MTIALNTTTRNNRLAQITSAIDAGSAGGTIKIYSGARPATGAALSGNTLLSTLTMPKPSAPSPSGGVLTFNSIPADTNAAATGTAAWARIADSNGNFVMDLSVTATGGGGDIQINNTSITAGQTVAVNSATITDGNP